MATKVAQKRLQKEYLAMQKAPPPFIWACPEEKNILDWHFIVRGPPDSVYAGGEYHGLITFPSDYPFKPPDVKMFTPSGRFECGKKICMSMTSYHPSSWNAAWSVATILTGLLSFMLSDEITTGGAKSTDEQKKMLAEKSHAHNLGNKKFCDVFPTYATSNMTDLPDMGVQPPPSTSADLKPSHPTQSPESSNITPASTLDTASPPSAPSDSLPAPAPVSVDDKPPVQALGKNPPANAARPAQWAPGWRWVFAVILLAVLGRLSSTLGLR